MKAVKMSLNFKELMILDHALNHYINRPLATQADVNDESSLLDRVNSNIKCIKKRGYGK